MFKFDVEIEGDIRTIDLVASFVGAGKIFLYFDSESSILLSVLEFVQFEVFFLEVLDVERVTYRF